MSWVDKQNGEESDILDMADLSTVSIAFYKFKFLSLSEEQNKAICEYLSNNEKYAKVWDIPNFMMLLKNLQVAYNLVYDADFVASKNKDDVMRLYVEEFLPFYKEAIEKALYIPID